jgi:hypothetical protein
MISGLEGRLEVVEILNPVCNETSAIGRLLIGNRQLNNLIDSPVDSLIDSSSDNLADSLVDDSVDSPSNNLVDDAANNLLVCIANAAKYKGKKCLARFDFYTGKGMQIPLGNFITSHIPDNKQIQDFCGLAPEEYLLYGKWSEEWHFSGKFPTIEQVNNYFDPGKMGCALFFKTNQKKARIWKNNFLQLRCDFNYAVENNLPNAKKWSRVVIFKSDECFLSLEKYAEENNLFLIEMEPIN